MSTTRHPPGITTHIHAQHIPAVAAQFLDDAPVISTVNLDALVETRTDEERARFSRFTFTSGARLRDRHADVAVGAFEPSQV